MDAPGIDARAPVPGEPEVEAVEPGLVDVGEVTGRKDGVILPHGNGGGEIDLPGAGVLVAPREVEVVRQEPSRAAVAVEAGKDGIADPDGTETGDGTVQEQGADALVHLGLAAHDILVQPAVVRAALPDDPADGVPLLGREEHVQRNVRGAGAGAQADLQGEQPVPARVPGVEVETCSDHSGKHEAGPCIRFSIVLQPKGTK